MDRRTYLTGSLQQAVSEFFRDYGLECTSSDAPCSRRPDAPAFEMGSLIGFTGAQMRGGLAFVAPAELVARTLPVPKVESRGERQLRDWSAEIANQLAGRLKNKLATVDFDVGTAICFRGTSVRFSFVHDAEAVSLGFTIASISLRVYLEYAFREEDTSAGTAGMAVIPEGDVVIF